MAIYRGPGGAGDATVDATNATAYVALKTQEATDAATAAAASAAEAVASAVIASDGLDGIAAYAAAAAGSAADALDSETNAEDSAVNAAISEANAAASAAAAAISEDNAAISEANANEDASTATTKAAEAADSADEAAASAAAALLSQNSAANSASDAAVSAALAEGYLPDFTGNNGKYLKTNGSAALWATVDALPSQTGNSGKYLTTNGTAASWVDLSVDPATPTVTGTVHGHTDTGTYGVPQTYTYNGHIAAQFPQTSVGYVYGGPGTTTIANAINSGAIQVGQTITITVRQLSTNIIVPIDLGVITSVYTNYTGIGGFWQYSIGVTNPSGWDCTGYANIPGPGGIEVWDIVTGGTVAENTLLGGSAGVGITTGGKNVVIGSNAGNSIGGGANNIVVGASADVSTYGVSNEVTLGNSSHTKTRLFGALAVGGSSTGTSGQILTSNGSGSAPSWTTLSSGTVTSVALSAPTGLTVSGSPVTTSGTLALSYTAGYSIPTDTKQTNWDTAYGWGNHASAGYLTGITSGQVTTALGYTPENSSNKNAANGYAGLDSSGLVPSSILPSYVDDVLEYANLASFPGTGATGKIYVALDTNKIYRWSGSTYIEISASPGSTDAVTEGSTNLYFTNARARSAISASGSISYNSSTGVISYTQPTNVSTFTNDSGYITSSALSPYLTSSTAASTYAPLTGTGTSGTWGISITGNAATVTNGLYSTGSYSNPTWLTSISGSIVSGNISGNAANVTGTVAIANGGSGQTTAQAAMNAFAGAVTSGSYLRGNGTNVVMSTIQAADVPTLNQNTTGTAANVTGTVAVANGGTGSTTLTANNVLLGNGSSALQVVAPGTSGNVLTSNGTTWVSSAPASSGISTGKSIAMAMIFGF